RKRRSRLGSSERWCCCRRVPEEAREGGREESSGSDLMQREGSRRLDRGRSGCDYVGGKVHNKIRESGRFAPKTMNSRWPCRAPLSKPKENFGRAVA
ncbi:hypothetical protein GW17_00042627, partial [Ensete ventricosum]